MTSIDVTPAQACALNTHNGDGDIVRWIDVQGQHFCHTYRSAFRRHDQETSSDHSTNNAGLFCGEASRLFSTRSHAYFCMQVCCIIVFGCIVGGGSASSTCYIDPDSKTGTCAFGVFVGVVGFILCLAYLIVDYLFELTNNIFVRKYTVLSDFAASTVWGLMFFVAFCVLAAKWTSAKAKNSLSGAITGNVQAAIAFAFFSTAGFVRDKLVQISGSFDWLL